MNRIIEKIIDLLFAYGNQYRNYDIELKNGDRVSISKERCLVFYEKLCKGFRDGYAYDVKCINGEAEEKLYNILNKVKRAIVRDVMKY